MPEISVIIPIYQVEDTLRRCVDSVLGQTYADYEIILVDDGSPDRCPEICDDYAQQHQNITVIHKNNGGLSDARNAGLSAAQGSYVMFLDSDDYLSPDCLETLAGHDADLVIGTIVRVHKDRQVPQKPREDAYIYREDYGEKLPALLDENRLNYIHAKLYRKSVIDRYSLRFEDDMLTSAEDTVFNFTFLKYCGNIYISAKPVHYYTLNSGGLGNRFYPDRYERYCRLNRFLADICKEMDIYNADMQREIAKRKGLSACWSVGMILAQVHLSRQERIKYLDRIAADRELLKIMDLVDAPGKDDVVFLLKYGSLRLILHKYKQSYIDDIKQKLKGG